MMQWMHSTESRCSRQREPVSTGTGSRCPCPVSGTGQTERKERPMSQLDIEKWVSTQASISELRQMREACETELFNRSYVCSKCGEGISTALPLKHPDHARTCPRYASMVTY